MSHFAPDAVWQSRFGTRLEGITAIRSYAEEFDEASGLELAALSIHGTNVVHVGSGKVTRIAVHSDRDRDLAELGMEG